LNSPFPGYARTFLGFDPDDLPVLAEAIRYETAQRRKQTHDAGGDFRDIFQFLLRGSENERMFRRHQCKKPT
jgi:hypothetical protein